jgi:hypothetical protein
MAIFASHGRHIFVSIEMTIVGVPTLAAPLVAKTGIIFWFFAYPTMMIPDGIDHLDQRIKLFQRMPMIL